MFKSAPKSTIKAITPKNLTILIRSASEKLREATIKRKK